MNLCKIIFLNTFYTMVYANKRKSYSRKNTKPRRKNRTKRSAMSIAKRALTLAKKTSAATTETKYLALPLQQDIANTTNTWLSSLWVELTNIAAPQAPCFGTDAPTGNKSFLKYIKGFWEIHSDNVNNEEETINYTVSIVRPRKNWDGLSATNPCEVYQGQVFWDPRRMEVLYQKHFTLTMGGTSPGTAGESRKYGRFFLPVNRMIRYTTQGVTGRQSGVPADDQSRIYMTVHTDNTSVDTESGRFNGHVLSCYLDSDVNH